MGLCFLVHKLNDPSKNEIEAEFDSIKNEIENYLASRDACLVILTPETNPIVLPHLTD